MKALNNCSLGMIGAGKMATALFRGWLTAGIVPAEHAAAFDVSRLQLDKLCAATGVARAASNSDVVRDRDLVIVATRPQNVAEVLNEVRSSLRPGQLVVSIAAGVTLESIEAALPDGVAAIRVMPSTPCLVGAGASGFCRGRSASDDQAIAVKQLFDAVGTAVEVPSHLMDAVTGLSGSGPAYVFVIIEALADGGVRAGLDRATALKLAAQTLLGAARMVLETGEHPGVLKDQVASPGGTTIAGLGVLENRSVRGALMDAVAAATARSIELGQ